MAFVVGCVLNHSQLYDSPFRFGNDWLYQVRPSSLRITIFAIVSIHEKKGFFFCGGFYPFPFPEYKWYYQIHLSFYSCLWSKAKFTALCLSCLLECYNFFCSWNGILKKVKKKKEVQGKMNSFSVKYSLYTLIW